MQKAQVSPEGIQAHSVPSRSALCIVVSTPVCLTRRPIAAEMISSFPVFTVPTIALATSLISGTGAGSAGGTVTPESAASASYISAASAAEASLYFEQIAFAYSIRALMVSRSVGIPLASR